MKILNLTDFLALPGEVLYCKVQHDGPWLIEGLAIRTNVHMSNRGFSSVDLTLFGTVDFLPQEGDDSVALEFNESVRDGCYEDDQLFAVYEKEDVARLITRLQGMRES